MTRKTFTNAIKTYLDQTTVLSGVNLYSLSTRVMYMLLFNDANVSRGSLDCASLEQIEVVEELAAAYVVIDDIHPVEAVTLAYQRLSKSDVTMSDMKKIIEMSKKSAFVDVFRDTDTDDVANTIAYRQHLTIMESLHVCLNIHD